MKKLYTMKKILYFLLLCSSFVFSQEQLSFEKIVVVDSTITKEQLFNRVNNKLILIFGSNFKFERDVVISDKSQGIIKVKFSKPYPEEGFNSFAGGYVEFFMTFLFKDGRSKISLTDFRHSSNASMGVVLNTDLYPYNNYKMFKKTADKNWLKLRKFIDSYQTELFQIGENLVKKPAETESNW